jgi:hypothetical protein
MTRRAIASERSLKPRVAAIAAVALALVAAGVPAQAETTTPANQVNLTLSGDITAACNVGDGSPVDLGELRGGVGFSANLGLSCNVPFDLTLRSANGGLTHDRSPNGEGPFAGTLHYRLKVQVPLITPSRTNMGGDFTSTELRAARSISSGSGIAIGGATLSLVTQEPTGAGLLAGKYSETISLTIAPRV